MTVVIFKNKFTIKKTSRECFDAISVFSWDYNVISIDCLAQFIFFGGEFATNIVSDSNEIDRIPYGNYQMEVR